MCTTGSARTSCTKARTTTSSRPTGAGNRSRRVDALLVLAARRPAPLFPVAASREVDRNYLRRGVESARSTSPCARRGRRGGGARARGVPGALRRSLRLDEKPAPSRSGSASPLSVDPVQARRERRPGTTRSWQSSRRLAPPRRSTSRRHHGTPVDQPSDLALYARVAEGLPGAPLEDPALTPETDAVLAAHRDRITGTRSSTRSTRSRRCRSRGAC